MLAVTFPLTDGHFNTRKLQETRGVLDALISALSGRAEASRIVALFPRDYDALMRVVKNVCRERGVAVPNALEYRGVILVKGE